MIYVTTSKTGHYLLESKSLTVSGTTSGDHSHTVTINSDGQVESRPDNYTYRIWKRIL